MKKLKIFGLFQNDEDVEEEVNTWFEENPDIMFIESKLALSHGQHNSTKMMYIIYDEPTSEQSKLAQLNS